MKSDTVFKRAFNELLAMVASGEIGETLLPETELSARLGVSRTTVRKVLSHLQARGYVSGDGRNRSFTGNMSADAQFPLAETVPMSQQVEKGFMEWMLLGDTKPGTQINELELARAFGVGTTGVREFLNRFKRFGLIEKRPNAGWRFNGFTEDFALELFEIREMFELRSARALVALPSTAPVWAGLRRIEAEHHALLADIDERFHAFSDLDNRFHRLINTAVPNRFIDDYYDIITVIFHYHYQWNKRDERLRNEVAIYEHLAYLEALFSHDPKRVQVTCSLHLESAKKTMLAAFSAD